MHPTAAVVAVIGFVVTAALAGAAWSVHESNEDRLLNQRVAEAGAVLTAALPGIQTPLASTAELVEVTDADDAVAFERAMGPLVGEQGPFVSASVWRLDDPDPAPMMVVGDEPALAERPADEITAFLDRSAGTPLLAVLDLLDASQPRLGYSFTSPQDADFMVYAEGALPENRTAVDQPDAAFSDLDYAIYLGETESDAALLVADTTDLPIEGRRASEVIEFGDTSLLLIMTGGDLGGSLLRWLPWIVAGAGLATTAAAAILTERLLRRRDEAESLAADNSRLYEEQRNVAHTLQRSLLPERLPVVPGVDIAVHYEPGVVGMEIGGDWYDVMLVGTDHLLVVVGDVSGRGLEAATLMASLRYAIRAFGSQGDDPSTILGKLNDLDRADREGRFATVLCAVIDLASGTATIANAGHPNPLLLAPSGEGRFIETAVGVPVGVVAAARYEPVTVPISSGATLLAFTDGLFERRGESVDAGMARLREAAMAGNGSLDDLLGRVVTELTREGPADDAALLGLRWH